jgi:hypothetical protein
MKGSSLVRRWLRAVGFLLLSSFSSEAAELIMTDYRACRYCALFNREVGKGYQQTEAGHIAPLRRVSPLKKWPSDLVNVTPARHTPVFILVEHGKEVGRFAGYVGPDSFWSELNPLLKLLGHAPSLSPDLPTGSGLF